MILDLWKKIRAAIKGDGRNTNCKVLDGAETLKTAYRNLYRLAAQIDAHGDLAPYPHVARRLKEMAEQKRALADTIRTKIREPGAPVEEAEIEARSGKNHWGRMVRDLEDQKTLEMHLMQDAMRLSEDAPDISEFLRGIASAQRAHREALLDLAARADPQAGQS